MMKSPRIRTKTVCVLAFCSLLQLSHGKQPLILWTQKSSIWSHIRGVSGDVLPWIQRTNEVDSTYIRSGSMSNSFYYGITYDHVTDTVCWSDVLRNEILCQPFSYTSMMNLSLIRTIVHDQTLNIRGISVDWHTGNVYFASEKSIAVAPSRGGGENVYKFLLFRGFKNVTGIAVDPDANLMFWTDSATSEIGSATLAGRDRSVLFKSDGHPMGITVVPGERRVYWVVNNFGNLESVGYDGLEWRRHIQDDRGKDFKGLVIHQGYALITGTNALKLHCYNRSSYEHVASVELDARPFLLTALDIFPNRPPHECDTKGCQHICLNLGDDRGVCVCKTGYLLAPDGVSCIESQPRYVYTTGTEVLFATATIDYSNNGSVTLVQSEIVRERSDVRALGYHFGRNQLFFSDISADVIFRGDPELKDFQEHTVNTRNVEGIAVDWLTSNVYWTDKTLRHIMVSQLDGRYHKILVPNAGQPTGIAVDANERRLFWNDVTEGQERVMTSYLDGAREEVLIDASDNIMHPQGIFIDPHYQRLYWVDKDLGIIECTDYEGRNRQSVLERRDETELFYDVTVYQDLTTWTDINGGLRFRNTLTDEELEVSVLQNTTHETYDVIVYAPYLQPQAKNPCEDDNGRCGQLCFPTPLDRVSCGCAIGFRLNENGLTCDTVTVAESFVLFTDPYHKQVYQSSLLNDSPAANGMHLPLMDYPISVDYDAGKGRVFWIDLKRMEFKRANLKGDKEKIIRMIPVGSQPSRLAVDARNGWLYYADWQRGTVSRMSLDGDDHADIITGLDRPFDVAVDYTTETIAWTHDNKIEVSAGNGSNRRILDDAVPMPSGVTFLPGEQMLYSCDNDTGTIYSYNLTTSVRLLVYEYRMYHIYSLAASPDHIFFSTYNEKAVYRVDRLTGQGLITVGDPVFARVTDVKVVQGSIEPAYAVGGGGFLWIILVGALAGLLLLALVLLAAILGVRRRRRLAKQDAESQGVDNDVDREYAYLNQSTVFDLRGSHNAMNNGVNGTTGTNGELPNTGFDDANGRAENVYSGVLPTPDVIQGSENAMANAMYNDIGDGQPQSNGGLNGTGHNGLHNGVPVGGVAIIGASTEAVGPAAIAAARKHRFKSNKKTLDKKKRKSLPRDPEFEFSPDNKVATKIQRLAGRLRNRLSSVRWSGDKEEGVHTGVPDPGQAPTLQAIGPERTGPDKNKRLVHIPPNLHEMPRGFAPASHCVPRNVKTSLNATKLNNMVDKDKKLDEADDTR